MPSASYPGAVWARGSTTASCPWARSTETGSARMPCATVTCRVPVSLAPSVRVLRYSTAEVPPTKPVAGVNVAAPDARRVHTPSSGTLTERPSGRTTLPLG